MTDYSKKGHYYIEEPRFELKYLMPLLTKDARVLDMGAGNGNNTKLFLEKGYQVTPVEPNPPAIKILQELQKELNYFFEVFQKNELAVTRSPFYGDLNYEENIQLLYKHAAHHLKQFGVTI